MNTVAEGIETEAQAAIVRQLGCDKGQGYLFSRPVPEAELRRWLGPHPDVPAANDPGGMAAPTGSGCRSNEASTIT